jgi:hypothetical protein
MTFICWKCGATIEITVAANRVGKSDTCPACDYDLHSCLNCRFYDAAKHNQCAETQAEWVRDKEAANYCDYFSPNTSPRAGSGPSKAGDAKKKFDSLFKL